MKNFSKNVIKFFLVLTFTLAISFFVKSENILAQDPPQPPIPNECLSVNLVPTVIVDYLEENLLLPKMVALDAMIEIFGDPVPDSNDAEYELIEIRNYSHFNAQSESYNPNFEFNIDDYYCDKFVDDNIFDPDFFSCFQGIAKAPDWLFLELWPEIIEDEFNGNIPNFKNAYIGSDGLVGNYGVQNALWINDGEDGFYDQSWRYFFCWGSNPQECNYNFLRLPSQESEAECQGAMQDLWIPYFLGFGFGGIGGGIGSGGWNQDQYGLPMGGRVTSAYPCLCSGTWAVNVTSPGLPGLFTYIPGMGQFANFRLPIPSFWTIGIYSNQQACIQWSGLSCSLQPNNGIITPIVGTSAF